VHLNTIDLHLCIFQVQASASMMEPFLTRAKDLLFESILSDIKLAAALRSLVEQAPTQDLAADEMMQQVQQDLPNLTPPPTLPGPDNMVGIKLQT
jgi:hypothetical protein